MMTEPSEWQIPGSGVEIYEHVFVPTMMGWAAQVIALTPPQRGDHILDVACGTGALTRLVVNSIGRGGRVVGLDINPDMLAVARTIPMGGSQSAPVEWQEGNVQAIPFANESFDIVFCAFGLMFFPDKVAALKEMRRVLKPSGCLAVSVWGPISKSPGQVALKESWERHFGAEAGTGFARMHVLSDPEIVRSLLDEAGFSRVSVEPTMGVVRHRSPECMVRSVGAMLGTQADEQTRIKLIQEVSEALHPYVGADGLVYPIEAILASAKK
jgi:ubiquinone/menaquinone biosynthesis C-methylase UbiE